MKKLITLLITCLLLTACSIFETEKQSNETFDETGMVTVNGESVDLNNTNTYYSIQSGFGFTYPEDIDVQSENYVIVEEEGYGYLLYYVPDSIIELNNEINDSLSDDDINNTMEIVYDNEYPIFAFIRNDESNLKVKTLFSMIENLFDNYQLVIETDDDKYYFFYNDIIEDNDYISEDDEAAMQEIIYSYEEIMNSLFVFPAETE